MGQITVAKNPFCPSDRMFVKIPEGATVRDAIAAYGEMDFEVVVVINGLVEANYDRVLTPDDHMTISAKVRGGGGGGSKGTLRLVAMIIVMAVATYFTAGAATPWLQATFTGMSTGTAGLIGMGIGMAVMAGGMMLINQHLPPPTPEVGAMENRANGNQYGWNPARNQVSEGLACSVLYGKSKITPQVISNYRTYDESKDQLNVLFHLTEGESDSYTDLRINNISIDDLLEEGVEAPTFKNGAINQNSIDGFDDSIYEKPINHELEGVDDEVIFTTDGNAVTNIAVGIIAPGGVYRYKDGKYRQHRLSYTIQYRLVGSGTWIDAPGMSNTSGQTKKVSGYVSASQGWGVRTHNGGRYTIYGQTKEEALDNDDLPINYRSRVEEIFAQEYKTWTEEVVYDYDAFHILNNTPDTIRHRKEIKGLTAGQYEVKVVKKTDQPTISGKNTYVDNMGVSFIQEITEGNFRYPYRSILAIKAVATEKLYGGQPVISMTVDRGQLKHYPGEYGVGTPTLHDSSNPAWACYDLLTDPMYGLGLHPDRIILQEFQDWADFCDSKNLKCNIYLDSISNAYDTLNQIGLLGFGGVVGRGTSFGCLYEGPSSMVYVFGMGNIIEGTFNMSYIEREARAKVIEVTYYDELLDYDRRILSVRQEGQADTTDDNTASINYIGCTSKDQANLLAHRMLRQNLHLLRTVSFEADVDAIHCQVGDVIGVSHDVPQYGFSGRVFGGTSNTLEFDRPIHMDAGTNYSVIVKHEDDTIETKPVQAVGASGEYTTITLQGTTWSTTPKYMENYSFGPVDSELKKFRVVSLARSKDCQVKISAMEYRDEIYDDAVTLPDYDLESSLDSLNNLELTRKVIINADGTYSVTIVADWLGVSPEWKVSMYRQDGFTKDEWNTYAVRSEWLSTGIIPRDDDIYTVTITALDGKTITKTISINIEPPGVVENIRSYVYDQFVQIYWEPGISEVPISHYEIYRGDSFDGSEYVTQSGGGFTSFYEVNEGLNKYWVVAVNALGAKGVPRSVEAEVKEQGNYDSLDPIYLDGTGTATDVYIDGNSILGPVGDLSGVTLTSVMQDLYPVDYATKTLQDVVDDFGYGTLTSMISVTGPEEASYVEVIDLGNTITRGDIILQLNKFDPNSNSVQNLDGYADVNGYIEYSPDNVNWFSTLNALRQSAEGFRYLRVTLEFSGDGDHGIWVTPEILIKAPIRYEAGSEGIDDLALGTVIPFKTDFIDVHSIQVTPKGSDERFAVYDFDDVPNPTDFTVKLFDKDGNSIYGDFSYHVTGI